MQQLSRAEAVDELREQAASCRRLSRRAQTNGDSSALKTVADQFDEDARRIDPSSERR
jgi:lambda repressor-like predicted transcriptional regulator